jgi:hypothetical protein
MKGAVYEKFITIRDTHEFQIEKEHIYLYYVLLKIVGADITVGRGGKVSYPMNNGDTLVLYGIDMATLYIKGAGGGELLYIIGTEK